MDKILLAVDGSAHSEKDVAWATEVAKRVDAEIVLL
jgi:nucleotide-binding universal stress UspA family protein